MRRRDTELSKLFERLYEYNVLGKVTNEQFRMLSGDYNTEQKGLKERILRQRSVSKNCRLPFQTSPDLSIR